MHSRAPLCIFLSHFFTKMYPRPNIENGTIIALSSQPSNAIVTSTATSGIGTAAAAAAEQSTTLFLFASPSISNSCLRVESCRPLAAGCYRCCCCDTCLRLWLSNDGTHSAALAATATTANTQQQSQGNEAQE
jgi:hypothetical protein